MRRLLHRLPVRLRHHWKVVAACGLFFAALVGLAGTTRVTPIVTSDERAEAAVVTQDVTGTVDLFDGTKPHRLTLSYSDDDYQRMLDQYWEDGEKEYVEADLVIDGTALDSVGIRLKGNSTLAALTRNGERAPNGFGGRAMGGGGPAGGGAFGGGAPLPVLLAAGLLVVLLAAAVPAAALGAWARSRPRSPSRCPG
ncbi:hypothetical protein [Phytohabitans rumicis]|uniref:Uncharacterized protein n=1 Tax=Phytohabitans rumicis TaxID=1076125 RepID=A0A6V8LQD2_9ACTN|nr:hypothetical protein [Phytohabitans rumicis]GFJ94905.1 hypothetical protein Prum_085470 [Phytohabitans rumicis]